mmetsp:Transcript_35927/g.95167  ORF Transcript_35927/g.95167 Transcript_35927/m.95167 type:complete len:218 (-) Transcript_35927:350-1003(-)
MSRCATGSSSAATHGFWNISRASERRAFWPALSASPQSFSQSKPSSSKCPRPAILIASAMSLSALSPSSGRGYATASRSCPGRTSTSVGKTLTPARPPCAAAPPSAHGHAPDRARKRVLFPAPLGPVISTLEPAKMERLRPSSRTAPATSGSCPASLLPGAAAAAGAHTRRRSISRALEAVLGKPTLAPACTLRWRDIASSKRMRRPVLARQFAMLP